MEGVVPAHAGGDNAKWLIVDCVSLVGHEEVCGSGGGREGCFAVLERPLQLLDCDENLAQVSVNPRLA